MGRLSSRGHQHLRRRRREGSLSPEDVQRDGPQVHWGHLLRRVADLLPAAYRCQGRHAGSPPHPRPRHQRGVQGLRHQGCRPRLRGAHRALLVPPGDLLAHDSNKDGNVTEYAFATMVDKVLMLPLKLELVKTDEKFFGEDIAKKDQIRKEQFAKYNTRGDGKMSFDEFLAFCMENIFKKM